eukprot:535295-Alexandrium_andersonii.AAC.1
MSAAFVHRSARQLQACASAGVRVRAPNKNSALRKHDRPNAEGNACGHVAERRRRLTVRVSAPDAVS